MATEFLQKKDVCCAFTDTSVKAVLLR